MTQLFTMSEVVKQIGIAASTIRYYEAIKLTPPAQRSQNGYRVYTAVDIERLRFIQRAKALDFTLNEITEILELREQGQAPCAYVISQITRKSADIDRKIAQLNQIKTELAHLQTEVVHLPAAKVAAKECVCHIIENERLTHLSELTAVGLS